jgi:arabinan endo-1,5-alpha-L-arabinosidase
MRQNPEMRPAPKCLESTSRGRLCLLLGAVMMSGACGGTQSTPGSGGAGSGGSAGATAGGGSTSAGGKTATGGSTSISGATSVSGSTSMAGASSGGSSGSGGSTAGSAGTAVGGEPGGGAGGAAVDNNCDAGVWDGKEPSVQSLSGNIGAHDPTMIEAQGVFYRFWTGNHIPQATSTDLKSWQNAPSVYGNSYPSWSSDWLNGVPNETFNFPWAPDVSFFNGQYHLYSSFSAIFGDNVSCITHLTTDDIASGKWTDHGPVICTEGDESYNAIDADVALDASGTPWLSFGSFWDGIMAFRLNADGSRAGTDMTRLAWASQIEAPVLFRRCDYYYLFVTWGLCCPGEGRTIDQLTYRVAVGRSSSITGPYLDRAGKPMLEGGGTLLVEGDGVEWAAAGHSDVLVTGKKIYHLYHAYRQSNGAAQLRIVELPFDEEGWPVAGGP